MRYVLDASVAVRWFVAEGEQPHAELVLERLLASPEEFAMPELFFCEVFSVLARTRSDYRSVYVEGFLPLVESGPLRYPMAGAVAERAADLVDKGLSGYDACYVALAAELQGLWLTFDGRACRAVDDPSLAVDLADGLPDGW